MPTSTEFVAVRIYANLMGMSVATHLKIYPEDYDIEIRGLIPGYDEIVGESSRALRLAGRKVETILDLGIGTGALARASLDVIPKARIIGFDLDASMMAMIPMRLGRKSPRVKTVHGDFTVAPLPECDAITGTFAFHHIRDMEKKQDFYRRAFQALRPGGILIAGDCNPSSTPEGIERGLEEWHSHLARKFGRAKGKRVFESWADEDFYVPLKEEIALLERAGFEVEVVWRRIPMAVLGARKPGGSAR